MIRIALITTALLIAAACSGESSPVSETTSTTTSSAESAYTCTINGIEYECPSQEELEACALGEPNSCSEAR